MDSGEANASCFQARNIVQKMLSQITERNTNRTSDISSMFL